MSFQRVDSEVLNISSGLTKEVLFGPAKVQALKVNFDSTTNSNLNLNYQFAPGCIVQNDWYIQYSMTLQVVAPPNAIAVGQGLFASSWGKTVAPRNYPILWAMNSTTLRLNDQVFSTQLKDLMPYMSKCISNEDAMKYSDVGTSLPDQGFFNYSDAVNTTKNVLAGFNNSRENWTPRGSWAYDAIGSTAPNGIPDGVDPLGVAGNATTGYVKFTMTTPLIIPPLSNLATSEPISLANLYNINLNIVFDGTFAKCLSTPVGWVASASGVANVFGSSNGDVNLLMISNYSHSTQSIPKEVKVPNTIYDIKTQNVPAIAHSSSSQLNSQIYQYDSYPDAFVVYAHKRLSQQTSADADVFLPFSDTFNITINGDNNLLNGYTKAQMYQLCKKYARMDFQEFSGFTNSAINGVMQKLPTAGPVYVFKPAVDLPISDPTIAPNMSGYRIQMQFNNLNIQNFTSVDFGANDLEFVVIAIRSGEVILTPSSGSQTSNVLTKSDVVSALSKEPIFTGELEQLEGGKMRKLVSTKCGRGKSGGGKSGGMISLGVAVPKTHTSRF